MDPIFTRLRGMKDRRDWPLVAAGFGVAAIGLVAGALVLLGYSFEPGTTPRPCEAPEPPAALIDGCGLMRRPFGEWVVQPSVLAGLGFALLLLAIAGETIRRGVRQRTRA